MKRFFSGSRRLMPSPLVTASFFCLSLIFYACVGSPTLPLDRNRGESGSDLFSQNQPDTTGILEAMERELQRSLDSLHLHAGAKPYFLAYMYWDIEQYRVEATLGTLEQNGWDRMQYLGVDLRLGDYERDNTGYLGSIVFGPRLRAPLPRSNDTTLLRQAIWAATDAEYKVAIEKLAQKKAYLRNHSQERSLPDFSRQEINRIDLMEKRIEPDTNSLKDLGVTVSAGFNDYPELQESRAAYNYFYSTLYYVDSEGSRYRLGFQENTFLVSLLAQADDGAPLWDYFRCSRRDTPWCGESNATDLGKKAAQESKDLAERTLRLSQKPPERNYRGPALLQNSAGGDLLYKALLAPQSQLREPLGSQSQRHFLLSLEGRKYFPTFVSIQDDPARYQWNDQTLYGHYAFDHQAQSARAVDLVKDGKIVDYYRGKIPLQPNGEHKSNGHWRYGGGFPGVVELHSKTTRNNVGMFRDLCRLSEEEGIGYAMVIAKVADEDALALLRHPLSSRLRISEAGDGRAFALNTPVHMGKVDCRTRKIDPVRGLTLSSMDSKSLRDIVATGESPSLYEPQAAFSALVPDLLFSLMDMKGDNQPQPRLPYLPPSGNFENIVP